VGVSASTVSPSLLGEAGSARSRSATWSSRIIITDGPEKPVYTVSFEAIVWERHYVGTGSFDNASEKEKIVHPTG